MKRGLTIIAVAVVIAAVAVGLRVRSQFVHKARLPVAVNPTTRPASRPAINLPMPRDYAAEPVVDPAETQAGPRRIISLAPSITETVCALGLGERLVGRTRYCEWPPGISGVPAIGVLGEVNYGLIKSLQPDLVLTTHNSGETTDNLGKLGIRCEGVPHEGLDAIYRAINRVGALCDRPKTAGALAAAIRADMDRLKRAAADLGVPPKRAIVLFGELPVPPRSVFVAGPGLFLDKLVELAGHRNAAREILCDSQGEIPLERMRVLDPQVVLEFRPDADPAEMEPVYAAWARVGDLQFVNRRQVRSIGGPQWLSAGPRIALELHRFITVLSEPE